MMNTNSLPLSIFLLTRAFLVIHDWCLWWSSRGRHTQDSTKVKSTQIYFKKHYLHYTLVELPGAGPYT